MKSHQPRHRVAPDGGRAIARKNGRTRPASLNRSRCPATCPLFRFCPGSPGYWPPVANSMNTGAWPVSEQTSRPVQDASPSAGGPTQVAREQASEVGRTTEYAGRQVFGTAAEQAKNVAQDAKVQARDLVGEARSQVAQQARTGQHKAADGIRNLAGELREMTQGGAQSGPASEVARQLADRAERVADWLGGREPGDLVEDARGLARRKPGVFLLGATLAGVLAGRLTRGVVDSSTSSAGLDARPPAPHPTPGEPTSYPRVPATPPTNQASTADAGGSVPPGHAAVPPGSGPGPVGESAPRPGAAGVDGLSREHGGAR